MTGPTLPVAALLAAYGLEGRPVEPVQVEAGKLVLRVLAAGGPVALKELHHDRERSLFALAAQHHVAARGGNVAPVLPARDGSLLVALGGRLFAAFRWLQGRRPNPAAPGDWAAMVQGLARFHRASPGYVPPAEARVSSKLGRWPHLYAVMLRQLQECQELLPRRLGPAAARQLAPAFAYCLERGRAAGEQLLAAGYGAWCQQVVAAGNNLCHQDYGPGNALITAAGPVVIDLDGVTFDLPARDLRKLADKLASRRGWDPAALGELVALYRRAAPLPAPELALLRADLLFPHGFHGVVKNLRREAVAPARVVRAFQAEQAKEPCLAAWRG